MRIATLAIFRVLFDASAKLLRRRSCSIRETIHILVHLRSHFFPNRWKENNYSSSDGRLSNLIMANYNYHQYLSASWNFIIPRFPNTRIQNRISYQRWKPRSLRVFRGNNPSSGISVFTFVNYTSCIVSRWKAILKFPSIDIYIYITILIYVAVQASRVHLVVDRRESASLHRLTQIRRLSWPSNGRRISAALPLFCIYVASTLIAAFPFRDAHVFRYNGVISRRRTKRDPRGCCSLHVRRPGSALVQSVNAKKERQADSCYTNGNWSEWLVSWVLSKAKRIWNCFAKPRYCVGRGKREAASSKAKSTIYSKC